MACFRVHVIFLKSGFWVYPVLEVLNWWQRIIFFLSLLFLQAGMYFVGETLNKAKWGKTIIWDYLKHLVWKNKFTLFRSIKQLHIWFVMYYKINLHSIHVRIADAHISCTWFHLLQTPCSHTLNWWQRSYL